MDSHARRRHKLTTRLYNPTDKRRGKKETYLANKKT